MVNCLKILKIFKEDSKDDLEDDSMADHHSFRTNVEHIGRMEDSKSEPDSESKETFLTKLEELQFEERFCDVTLACEDNQILGHKIVLTFRIKYIFL